MSFGFYKIENDATTCHLAHTVGSA